MDTDRARRLAELIQLRRGRRLLHKAVKLRVPEVTVYRMRRRLKQRAEALGRPLFVAPLLRR